MNSLIAKLVSAKLNDEPVTECIQELVRYAQDEGIVAPSSSSGPELKTATIGSKISYYEAEINGDTYQMIVKSKKNPIVVSFKKNAGSIKSVLNREVLDWCKQNNIKYNTGSVSMGDSKNTTWTVMRVGSDVVTVITKVYKGKGNSTMESFISKKEKGGWKKIESKNVTDESTDFHLAESVANILGIA